METQPLTATPLKALCTFIGVALLGMGGQPLVNYLSGDSSLKTGVPSIIACLAGLAFIAGSLFWRPKLETAGRFVQILSRWANSPVSYAVIFVLVWIYFETWAVVRNNEIVATRNDMQSIAKVVDRLVLPRHLTKNQQKMISSFLLQFEPHEYAFRLPLRDEEVGSYRVDIEQALMKGGWTRATDNPYVYADDEPEGLSINFTQTMEHSQKQGDWRNPNPSLILQEALGIAGVRLNQTGSGSGINVTKDRLEIGIGHPRRDSYELTPPD